MFSEVMLGFSIGALVHLLQFWQKSLTLTMPRPLVSCIWKTTITRLEGQLLLHMEQLNLKNDKMQVFLNYNIYNMHLVTFNFFMI